MKEEYTQFINEIFDAIKPVLPAKMHPYTAFSEGPGRTELLSSQDNAVLRRDPAVFFLKSIRKNSALFNIDRNKYKAKRSITVELERTVSYNHSCYPKNIRRWMNGTIPRRKKSRVEFCALVYCWAVGWSSSSAIDEAHLSCQTQLRTICKKYGTPFNQDLIEVLWTTFDSLYRRK